MDRKNNNSNIGFRMTEGYTHKGRFYSLIISEIAIFLLFSLLQLVCDELLINNEIMISIVTTVLVCILTIYGLSINILNIKVFGLPMKLFYKLRVDIRYTMEGVLLNSIILTFLNICYAVFNYSYMVIGVSTMILIYIISLVYNEIPIIAMSEIKLRIIISEAIEFYYKINDDKIKNNTKHINGSLYSLINKNSYDTKYINIALSGLLKRNNLINVYNKYKVDIPDEKSFLLDRLLTIQEDIVFEEYELMDNKEREEFAKNVISNINSIMYFNIDIMDILQRSPENCYYIVTRLFFALLRDKKNEERINHIIIYHLTSAEYRKQLTSKQKKFIGYILLTMLSLQVMKNNFTLINCYKKEFYYYISEKSPENPESVIFYLLSLQLYYLHEDETNITGAFIQQIDKLLDDEGLADDVILTSWREYFSSGVYYFNVDFSTMKDCYDLVSRDWNIFIKKSGGHDYVLSLEYLIEWYFANLMLSMKADDVDLDEQFRNLDKGEKLILARVIKNIVDKDVKTWDKMKDMIGFFCKETSRMDKLSETDLTKHLGEYRQKILKNNLQEDREDVAKQNIEDIRSKLIKSIDDEIINQFGFDKNVKIKREPRYIYYSLEKHGKDGQYENVLIESIIRSIKLDMRKSVNSTTIYAEERNYNCIQAAINKGVKYVVNNAKYLSSIMKRDENCNDINIFNNEKIKNIESDLLPVYGLITSEDAFKYNFNIITCELENYSDELVQKEIDKCKKVDDKYLYKDVLLTKTELEMDIRERFYTLKLIMEYDVKSDEKNIFSIQLY